jgi:hypothetical protein
MGIDNQPSTINIAYHHTLYSVDDIYAALKNHGWID